MIKILRSSFIRRRLDGSQPGDWSTTTLIFAYLKYFHNLIAPDWVSSQRRPIGNAKAKILTYFLPKSPDLRGACRSSLPNWSLTKTIIETTPLFIGNDLSAFSSLVGKSSEAKAYRWAIFAQSQGSHCCQHIFKISRSASYPSSYFVLGMLEWV